ncbi:MAG: AzlD domain-containing protein [Burkholderiaceae bacterium]|nr:AzlD domain-containing protein [Burkholderiaceae bacterium]
MSALDGTSYTVWVIAGLAVVTLITRSFFLLPEREVPIPSWLQRGLKVAPLAALTAVVLPEIVMTQGHLIGTWHDARLPAAVAATLWCVWRPGVLGPLLAGLAVFLPLRLLWGW